MLQNVVRLLASLLAEGGRKSERKECPHWPPRS